MQQQSSSMSAKNLLVSIFKYSIATWVNFLIYGLSLLLSAWFISAEVYGQVDIFISTSTLFMNICILGLDQSFIRFFNEPPEPLDKQHLFGACFGLSAVALAVTCLVSCIYIPQQVLGIFFSRPLDNIYLALLFLKSGIYVVRNAVRISGSGLSAGLCPVLRSMRCSLLHGPACLCSFRGVSGRLSWSRSS